MNEQQQLKHEAAVQRAAQTKAERAAQLRRDRLNNAAPDLLAALKAWLDSDVNQSQAEERALIEMARAAIQKAEGRSD